MSTMVQWSYNHYRRRDIDMKLATPAQLRAIVILHEKREVPVAGQTDDEALTLERIFDAGTGKMVSYQEAEAAIRYLNKLPKAGTVLEVKDERTGEQKHKAGDCECEPSGVRCSWYSWQYQTEHGRAENE